MFIRNSDFSYLEGLYQSLDEETRKRFLALLVKGASVRVREEILKSIQVVGDEIHNVRGTDPKEWVTRTMIKRAYKEAKQ